MCLICVEFEKERLTVFEAKRNLTEMVGAIEEDHIEEVREKLEEAEERERDAVFTSVTEGGNID